MTFKVVTAAFGPFIPDYRPHMTALHEHLLREIATELGFQMERGGVGGNAPHTGPSYCTWISPATIRYTVYIINCNLHIISYLNIPDQKTEHQFSISNFELSDPQLIENLRENFHAKEKCL